jgi:hypothetical protein
LRESGSTFVEAQRESDNWQGRIIGNGIHGSLNVLLIRMRGKLLKDTLLMRLLTICLECSEEGVRIEKMNYKAWIDQTLNSKDIARPLGT